MQTEIELANNKLDTIRDVGAEEDAIGNAPNKAAPSADPKISEKNDSSTLGAPAFHKEPEE